MKKILFAFILILLTAACSKTEYCSFLDKRFSCSGELTDNRVSVTFNSVPKGNFNLGTPELELYEEISEGIPKKWPCNPIDPTPLTKDSIHAYDCIPKEPGVYMLRFKIIHSEPGSYSPVQGETCLKSSNNMWSCDTRGYYRFKV